MQFKFVKYFFILLVLTIFSNVSAQESWAFENEVNELVAKDASINKKDIILFTGSSSIAMWRDVGSYFPTKNVLNRGFGGSQMTDLLHYFDKLILPYNPKIILIYEGDNDLSAKKSPEQIIAAADSLLQLIRTKVSKKVTVAFISPKPSLARWAMKDQYVAFNKKLEAWTKSKKKVKFIDVWTPMLDQNGEVQKDLFIEDGLHMNKKGYDIWGKTIDKYLN